MQVNVEITSKQIFKDHEDGESHKCLGEITYHNNGTVLEFTEKYEEQELKFKMTILEEKIITKRNGQDMIFDLKNKNKSVLATPYGEIKLIVSTKKIDILKSNNEIKQIYLEYEIELENGERYDNVVQISIN
ncbi:MAG: DUF1934 domain-containing protein [Clostridia bacterium]|nr:DUF1934 domain-containing protein [Clostridia bacterium]